ncbi:unnamed protein product [Rhizophagus irregularis]|nr:unnamed protein product [Rhizophagus irregularis]CAB4414809.1 unnamed protein product [Rhizophagus irregularis]
MKSSSLCQDSSSISINSNDNHEQNQHQAGYYESSDLFEDDDYKVEYDISLLNHLMYIQVMYIQVSESVSSHQGASRNN